MQLLTSLTGDSCTNALLTCFVYALMAGNQQDLELSAVACVFDRSTLHFLLVLAAYVCADCADMIASTSYIPCHEMCGYACAFCQVKLVSRNTKLYTAASLVVVRQLQQMSCKLSQRHQSRLLSLLHDPSQVCLCCILRGAKVMFASLC